MSWAEELGTGLHAQTDFDQGNYAARLILGSGIVTRETLNSLTMVQQGQIALALLLTRDYYSSHTAEPIDPEQTDIVVTAVQSSVAVLGQDKGSHEVDERQEVALTAAVRDLKHLQQRLGGTTLGQTFEDQLGFVQRSWSADAGLVRNLSFVTQPSTNDTEIMQSAANSEVLTFGSGNVETDSQTRRATMIRNYAK